MSKCWEGGGVGEEMVRIFMRQLKKEMWFSGQIVGGEAFGTTSAMKLRQSRDVSYFKGRGPLKVWMIGNAGKPHVHHWNQRGLDEGTVTVYVCALTKWRGEREREREREREGKYMYCLWFFHSFLLLSFDSFSIFCILLWCFSIQVGKQRLVGLCWDVWKEGMSVRSLGSSRFIVVLYSLLSFSWMYYSLFHNINSRNQSVNSQFCLHMVIVLTVSRIFMCSWLITCFY